MPTEKIPADLQKALAASSSGLVLWKSLTPIARRDFLTWINGAKQPETRIRRITKTCSVLAAGKRHPCCYAVVPMGLYKALGANEKAKLTWSSLTPDERRDFVSWVDEPKDAAGRQLLIEKACTMLMKGKRNPHN